MQITDPIADMLTRIRNAGNARHASVDVPASKMKKAIAQILLDEGYIKSFDVVEGNTQGIIRIALKYVDGRQKAITGIKRVSKPGLRVYAGAQELPKVLRGLGIAIVSTSRGVMTDKKARELNPRHSSERRQAQPCTARPDPQPGPQHGRRRYRRLQEGAERTGRRLPCSKAGQGSGYEPRLLASGYHERGRGHHDRRSESEHDRHLRS